MDLSSLPGAITDKKFRYFHKNQKGSPDAIDVHQINVKKSKIKKYIFKSFAFLLSASSICLFYLQGKLFPVLWSLFLIVLILRLYLQKLVEKESIIIVPGFGVQLETQFGSGRTNRRFIHAGNILKPVLNECVTPITCYWSLALIIRDEQELVLVFKELRPPIKMLVPIWKALNSAIDVKD